MPDPLRAAAKQAPGASPSSRGTWEAGIAGADSCVRYLSEGRRFGGLGPSLSQDPSSSR